MTPEKTPDREELVASGVHPPDQNPLDPRTTTGAYRILVKQEYGHRKKDKPWWWVLLYHFAKAVVGILPYVIAAIALKRCGISLPGSGS